MRSIDKGGRHHDLDDADDGVLLNYVGENLSMLGFSLLLLDAGEENEIQTEYLRRKDAADGSTKTWLPARIKAKSRFPFSAPRFPE